MDNITAFDSEGDFDRVAAATRYVEGLRGRGNAGAGMPQQPRNKQPITVRITDYPTNPGYWPCVRVLPVLMQKEVAATTNLPTHYELDKSVLPPNYVASSTPMLAIEVSGRDLKKDREYTGHITDIIWGLTIVTVSATGPPAEMVHIADPALADDEGLVDCFVVKFGPGNTDVADDEAALVLFLG